MGLKQRSTEKGKLRLSDSPRPHFGTFRGEGVLGFDRYLLPTFGLVDHGQLSWKFGPPPFPTAFWDTSQVYGTTAHAESAARFAHVQ